MNQESTHDLAQKKVALHTLGCRLNFSETGSMAEGFEKRGYQVVPFGEKADVTFINTCTVTDKADSTCRNLIRKAHKTSPEGQIVVAGCYAQMAPQEIASMKGVDLVLGTSEKYKVFDYLEEEDEQKIKVDKSFHFYSAATTRAEGHTRAFLKIQDGCNYICSFCIIPQARGRSRTITLDEAKKEAQNLIDSGFKEIVLTGVNIGEYEARSGEKLSTLIREISNISGLERLRLSSVEPNTFNQDLIQTLKETRQFLHHFHIPLQSGSDKVLKEMRRKYTRDQYREIIQNIHSRFPEAAFGADVIVGFPGETEKDFEDTYEFLKELPLTHFHVFPYSKRKGTLASKREDHIHSAVKKKRVRKLIELGEKKLFDFSAQQIGKVCEVLFERCDKSGQFTGYTPNYLKVKTSSASSLKNQIKKVEIIDFDGKQLVSKLI